MTRTLWPLLGAGMLLAACETPHPEQDPAYLKASAVEARVDVLERQTAEVLRVVASLHGGQAMVDEYAQLDELLATGSAQDKKAVASVLVGGWIRNPMLAQAKERNLGAYRVLDVAEPGAAPRRPSEVAPDPRRRHRGMV